MIVLLILIYKKVEKLKKYPKSMWIIFNSKYNNLCLLELKFIRDINRMNFWIIYFKDNK